MRELARATTRAAVAKGLAQAVQAGRDEQEEDDQVNGEPGERPQYGRGRMVVEPADKHVRERGDDHDSPDCNAHPPPPETPTPPSAQATMATSPPTGANAISPITM
jgi:hypothetical protein